jgi:hypothetical protein
MFCSIEDHEAGFKSLEVVHRSGRAETIRLVAPSRRAMRQARVKLLEDADPWQIVQLALGPGQDEKWFNSLDGASADVVECTCFALAFGVEWEKKMTDAAMMPATAQAAVAKLTERGDASTKSAPK